MDERKRISAVASSCREAFDTVLADPTMARQSWLRSAQGDFSLWCAATKALGTGKSSLSHCLANEETARNTICGLILALMDSVRTCYEAENGHRNTEEENTETTIGIESLSERPASPLSWDAISGASDSNSEDCSHDSLIAEHMVYIRTFLGHLSQLAVAIKRSGDKYRFARMDDLLDEREFEAFQKQLTAVVLRGFPDLEAGKLSATERQSRALDPERLSKIQRRLIHANLLRRNRIMRMRKLHRPRITEETQRVVSSTNAIGTGQGSSPNPQAKLKDIKLDVKNAGEDPDSTQLQPKEDTSVSLSQTPSRTVTKAGSDLNERFKKVLNHNVHSDMTKITRIAAAQSYPSCPKPDSSGDISCPYCGDAFMEAQNSGEVTRDGTEKRLKRSWRSHVAQDLLPYSCIMQDCKQPDKMFLTADNLLNHVVEEHSVQCWTCDYCLYSSSSMLHDEMAAPKEVFLSAEDWTQHVQETHGNLVVPENRKLLAETHKRRLIESTSCPLCEFRSKSWAAEIPDHILNHLHEFALRALPYDTEEPGDKISSRKTAGSASALSHTQPKEGHVPGLSYPEMNPQLLERAIKALPLQDMPLIKTPNPSELAEYEIWQARAGMLYAMATNCHEVDRDEVTGFVVQEIEKDARLLQYAGFYYPPPPRHPGDGSWEPTKTFKSSRIPSATTDFRGLLDIIDDLEEIITSGTGASETGHIALSGESTDAKRSVASGLAQRLQMDGELSVFWVQADTIDSVHQSLSEIAESFTDILTQTTNASTKRHHLLHYLTWSFSSPWLMVFDELNPTTTYELVSQRLLPYALRGHSLFLISDPRCAALLHVHKIVNIQPEDLVWLPAKRALLVGSPVGVLRGPENDLKIMAKLLKSHGFDVENHALVKTLFRETATRQNILEAWEALILNASPDDTVVIYYSGHGACVESDEASQGSGSPSKIQLIVPYDFDDTLATWKGILDGELSLLLRRTMEKTRNVTYILDCCHSARLGRKLGDISFEPKAFGLPKSLYADVLRIMEQLKQAGKLTVDHLETNRHAVRIAAAATDETAWEYHDDGHNYLGLLIKNLDRALTKSSRHRSWRDIMLEVGVLVGQDHPGGNQNPRSAGPDNRKPFSMTATATGALLATIWDEGYTTVHGGRVNGVREGDIYMIAPFGSQGGSEGKVATARVEQVNAFAAVLSPTPKPSEFGSTKEYVTGHAVLQKRRTRWPIRLSTELHAHVKICSLLDQSTFLRRCEAGENPLLNIRREQNMVFLQDNRGLQLAVKRLNNDPQLEDVVERLLDHAKEYGQARSILSLRSGVDEELLGDEVEIVLGLESNGKKNVLTRRSDSFPTAMLESAPLNIAESDRLYISIENKSKRPVFVNLLSVDASGKTTLVSKAWEKGVGLTPGRSHIFAVRTFPFRGIPLRWPRSVPRTSYVEESLVFVITNEEVDLRDLDTSLKGYVRRGPEEAAVRDSGIVHYDVEHVRYHLRPLSSF